MYYTDIFSNSFEKAKAAKKEAEELLKKTKKFFDKGRFNEAINYCINANERWKLLDSYMIMINSYIAMGDYLSAMQIIEDAHNCIDAKEVAVTDRTIEEIGEKTAIVIAWVSDNLLKIDFSDEEFVNTTANAGKRIRKHDQYLVQAKYFFEKKSYNAAYVVGKKALGEMCSFEAFYLVIKSAKNSVSERMAEIMMLELKTLIKKGVLSLTKEQVQRKKDLDSAIKENREQKINLF